MNDLTLFLNSREPLPLKDAELLLINVFSPLCLERLFSTVDTDIAKLDGCQEKPIVENAAAPTEKFAPVSWRGNLEQSHSGRKLKPSLNMPSFGFIINMGLLKSIRENAIGVALALVAILISGIYIFRRSRSRGCLDPKKFKEFRLIKKTQISPNSARFRFALPTPTSVLGLPVGQHIVCRGKDRDGKEVIRPYTPITLDSDLGYFELVVKMYPKGRMSHHFREMREGDYLPVKGPKGQFKYKPGQARAFGMLAGGSGITPMFQLIHAILENPRDKTKAHLIYANVTVNDILLKEDLDTFAKKFPDRFQVYYVLSQPHENWNGGIGHISKEMIRTRCPPPASDIQILRCGPPPMNKAMAAHLNELGYTQNMQFEF
ncbi:hypothetical protein NL676_037487 [Syzygium grande]|nr:hypothetical protein NL676_037487 [Syzygium grande]